MCRFLPAPSARRATQNPPASANRRSISIHALREEGDLHSAASAWYHEDFYPRPPRGGRLLHIGIFCRLCKFLSTPSARRATCFPVSTSSIYSNFYPRPPRGGRLTDRDAVAKTPKISIHALREEGDPPT